MGSAGRRKGEDPLDSIESSLQELGRLAAAAGESSNQEFNIAIKDVREENKKLIVQVQRHISSGKTELSKDDAKALGAVRTAIQNVNKKLGDLVGREQKTGFSEKRGLGHLSGHYNDVEQTPSKVLIECGRRLRSCRKHAEGLKAFDIQQRSLEKNRPPNYRQVSRLHDELLQYLREESSKIVIIAGMFGMGKSALALELASTLRASFDYPGGVHFITFGEEYGTTCSQTELDEKVCVELKHILKFVGGEMGRRSGDTSMPHSYKVNEIKDVLRTVLSSLRCLIVLDDVWHPRIWEDFWFEGHPGNLLITTRLRGPLSQNSKLFKISPEDYMDVERLDEKILAGKISGDSTNFQVPARMILAKCHGCPLAINVMGNAVRDKTQPREWQNAAQEFAFYAEQRQSLDGYASTMFHGVKSSIAACSGSKQAFTCFGLFRSATTIPTNLVKLAWTICMDTPVDEATFDQEFEAFVGVHILERVGTKDFCRVHPIVTDYLSPGSFLFQEKYLSPMASPRSNRIHLLCAFLLTYGHSTVVSQCAELLSEVPECDIDRRVFSQTMEGEIPEVGVLTRELSPNLTDEELSTLKKPVLAATLRSWGLAKVIQTQKGDGLVDLEEANRLQPEHPITLRNLGIAHFTLRKYNDAVEYLRAARSLNPHDSLTLSFLGTAMMGKSDWQGAKLELKDDLPSPTSLSLSSRGLLRWNLGLVESALEDFEQCPNQNPFILSLRGAVKMESGDLVGAKADLRKALTSLHGEDAAFTLCILGLTRLYAGDYGGAKEDLDRAVSAQPESAFCLSVRGEVNRMLKEYEAAATDLEKARQSSPDRFTIECLMNVRWMQGMFDETIKLAGLLPSQARDGSAGRGMNASQRD